MKETKRNELIEAVKQFTFENGNVRGLAGQMVSTLLKLEMGHNPHKLGWAIAKEVGDLKADFGVKEVMKVCDEHAKDLAAAPEHDLEFFQKAGKKGANSLSLEEARKYGKKGANSLTHADKVKNGKMGATSLTGKEK